MFITNGFALIPISQFQHLCHSPIHELCDNALVTSRKFFSLTPNQKLLSSNLFGPSEELTAEADVGFRFGKSREQELFVVRRPFDENASFPWPISPSNFAAVVTEYFSLLEAVGSEIIGQLNQAEPTIVDEWKCSVLFLRAYHRTVLCNVDQAEQNNRDGHSHTDSGTLTILYAKSSLDIAGLEFLVNDSETKRWMPVDEAHVWTEPSFVVFGGEGLSAVLGTSCAAVHRVRLNTSQQALTSLRVTLPFQLRSDQFHQTPTTNKKFMILL